MIDELLYCLQAKLPNLKLKMHKHLPGYLLLDVALPVRTLKYNSLLLYQQCRLLGITQNGKLQ